MQQEEKREAEIEKEHKEEEKLADEGADAEVLDMHGCIFAWTSPQP